MSKFLIGIMVALAIFVGLPMAIYVGTFNGLQRKDENVSFLERDLMSCYDVRHDKMLALQNVVREAAGSEKDITIGYATARSEKPVLPPNPTDADREAYAKAIEAANAAAVKLKAIAESVPHIKSNANYLRAQKDLNNILTQCAAKRRQYIAGIANFNASVRTIPSKWVAEHNGITVKKQIVFDNEDKIKHSPEVFAPRK